MRLVDVFSIAADAADRAVADAIVRNECGPQLLQLFRATARPQLLLTDGVVRSWRELRDRTGLPKYVCKAIIAADAYGMSAKRLQKVLRVAGASIQQEFAAVSSAVRSMLPAERVMAHAREHGVVVDPAVLARLRLRLEEAE